VFRNDKTNQLVDSRVTNNGDGNPQFTIGGLANFGNHHIDATIAEVRVYSRVVSQADVEARFLSGQPARSAVSFPQ
jgi:hypothetical protein